MLNPSSELDDINNEIKRVVAEIKTRLGEDNQDGTWKLQQELNVLYLKGMVVLTDWLKNDPRLVG